MTDIESGTPQAQAPPQNPPTPSEDAPTCRLGTLTLLFIVLSVVIYCVQLAPKLAFIPAKVNVLRFLFFSWFPFAVNTSGLLVNLVILLFFSSFFEKKFGTLGFLLKLEFFKFLFAILSLVIYKFLYFLHPSSLFSKMLTLGDFAMLFMILVSQEAFERPNDFSIIPLVNISFKNVSPCNLRLSYHLSL